MTVSATVAPKLAHADDHDAAASFLPERRNRNGNKEALVREDYWFMMGKQPPRKLEPYMLQAASGDPQYNAFGLCERSSSSGSNSCTYVPLKQRIPAYGKYGWSIALGAKEYGQLGAALKAQDLSKAQSYVAPAPVGLPPPPTQDALLKMVLLATQLLTTPNFTGLSKEQLVARFYINEAAYATSQIQSILFGDSGTVDFKAAMDMWEFGKDSWNSYLIMVNDQITAKVGDKIELIA